MTSVRYCQSCGSVLARDNRFSRCASCLKARAGLDVAPPVVPADFWTAPPLAAAFGSWHIGKVFRAYRHHVFHGRPLSQECMASWLGLTQAQLSRIEHGPAVMDLAKLVAWARVLAIPPGLLWFKLPVTREPARGPDACARPAIPYRKADPAQCLAAVDGDPVDRRELLRALSVAGALIALPRSDASVSSGDAALTTDEGELAQYEQLNDHLWHVFALARSKRLVYPVVHQQLGQLTQQLEDSHSATTHQRLCRLTADLLQLAGEVCFDANRYTDAAHCYGLAASASREASSYDLWACALTRHAFISLYEQRFSEIVSMLEAASRLAAHGDSQLSTGYWVAAVQAETYAQLGDFEACTRALDMADRVRLLSGEVTRSGWLRFDGSRLAEQRGTCYIALGKPELAQAALTEALHQNISLRRQGSILTDLAIAGLQRHDVAEAVHYGSKAVTLAQQTGSAGYVGRKLRAFQAQLPPFAGDRRLSDLSLQIDRLAVATS